ncbi:GntR family transcriptional regulator [Alkalihalobacillus alcalophilus ATCC 27647 = CGMCC 1.3604]|uniref:GntR family transcriptional regulator n=1 Tax=Alkalihalobacillus alcalophilus ATCC 27647 = CGMCC 1.3604 TaxID=1218173 RepID=A0A094WLC4_ALKAL|nr:GntR family transcriptional regulator [Alkalihalobacillus alcalophilus]KGA97666.1 GntR family transcriptional regulator [Alkalihalobacillus alcalophilus ATCC 27647 = CGMCC 1.3604]MED1561300.1 GntR family transcriptional regulator [Alkalihalobacillus alcalophilus]THG90344.1 GntR family transcriptional regulator [Alkalihalobacillus alcalophilus ATCC 27647 = CGMCC 1.3604]
MKNDKYEGKALHIRVKDEIKQAIKSGEYRINTKLPTEADFCELFDVSRTTVRTALNQLHVEGYVYKIQGSGTYVADNKVKQSLSATVENFNTQLQSQGKNPAIKVINLLVVPSDEFISHSLRIDNGSPVNKLERIRYADETPIQYEVAYLPWNQTPGLDRDACEDSLYSLLRNQYELKIKKTVEQIEIMLADSFIAQMLEIEEGSPCFMIETEAFLEGGQIIEYSKAYFRGDKANFIIERSY